MHSYPYCVFQIKAKAERDILYAMALKSPHPFTSGLKFAFQSENNLYLGMDFIPGGNLRELIKRMKFLPEVKPYFKYIGFYSTIITSLINNITDQSSHFVCAALTYDIFVFS